MAAERSIRAWITVLVGLLLCATAVGQPVEGRIFIQTDACGFVDQTWLPRPLDDGGCVRLEAVCERVGDRYIAGSVSAQLQFTSYDRLIRAKRKELSEAPEDIERRRLQAQLQVLVGRRNWLAPACDLFSPVLPTPAAPLPTVTPMVTFTATPTIWNTATAVGGTPTATPTVTVTPTSSPSPTPLPTATPTNTPTLTPTSTPTPLPVGDGSFTEIFASAQGGAYGVAVGDLDGLFDNDVVVAKRDMSAVAVMLASESGQLVYAHEYSVSVQPSEIRLAYINQDSHLDVVFASDSQASFSVMFGNGNGTFGAENIISTGSSAPKGLAVADVDGDDDDDVLVTNSVDHLVEVYLNNGLGNFGNPVAYTTSPGSAMGEGPIALAVSDFDGDNYVDVVVGTTSGSISFLRSLGSGSFNSPAVYTCGANVVDVDFGDFDGDLDLDIVGLSLGANQVCVLLNNGSGSFAPVSGLTVSSNSLSLAVGNFVGDSKPDLMVSNNLGRVQVFMGATAGSFVGASSIDVGGTPAELLLQNINGDSALDLVAANDDTGTIAVLYGDGAGRFLPRDTYLAGAGSKGVVVADVDNDAVLDVIVANSIDNNVSIRRGSGGRVFELSSSNITVGSGPEAVQAGDLNKDGNIDLVVANKDSDSLSVLQGGGSGAFAALPSVLLDSLSDPVDLKLVDLDQDNLLDIVVSQNGNSRLGILKGSGNGQFVGYSTITTTNKPRGLAVDLLDGGVDPDVAVAINTNSSIDIFRGLANIGLGALPTEAVGAGPYDVALVDVNGDKSLDLVSVNYFAAPSGSYSVLTNNGSAVFSSPSAGGAGVLNKPVKILASDLNADGRQDLIIANEGSGSVSIFFGRGNGLFDHNQDYYMGDQIADIALADLDGDYILDIVAANQGSGTFSVLYGNPKK